MSEMMRFGFGFSKSAPPYSSVFEELDRIFDRDSRMEMVEEQLLSRGICTERLIESMLDIPRHRFLPSKFTFQAHEDYPIPLGYRRMIFPPSIIGVMLEAADIQPHERVLEVGTGCGYTTALLSRFSPRHLISIDEVEEFVEESINRLQSFGLGPNEQVNILSSEDLSEGYPQYSPYDAIIVNPPIFEIPPSSLVQQLADNGRLVAAMIKSDGVETVSRFTRLENGALVEEVLFEQHNPFATTPIDENGDHFYSSHK